MTLHALKDGTIAAAKCRLTTPPASPSRGTTIVQSHSRLHYKSKLLAAFDSDPAFQVSENFFSSSGLDRPVGSTMAATSQAVAKPAQRGRTPNSSSLHVLEKVTTLNARLTAVGVPQNETLLCSEAPKDSDSAPPQPAAHYSYKDYTPKAAIIYTRHEDEANDLVETLRGPIGFDMEWRVVYRRGVSPIERRVATIQLSDQRLIMIIQISAMKKVPKKVKELIENPSIPKIGANIRNDGKKLLKDYGVAASNLVELGGLAREADPAFIYRRSIVSLSKMIAEYCDGKVLDKGPVRMSDWEAVPLSQEQLEYAANDAHSALMAYLRLIEIAAANKRNLNPSRYCSSVSENEAAELASTVTKSLNTQSFDVLTITRPGKQAVIPRLDDGSTSEATSMTFSSSLPPNVWGAYQLWHRDNMPLEDICAALRTPENPLARSTVISYVIRAVRTQPSLPYSLQKLRALVRLDGGSWIRNRNWIELQEAKAQSLN